MSWLATIVVAVVTAAVGMFAAFQVASLAVDWYRVSGFEGKAGYFAVSFALLGLVVGLVVGVVVSRVVGEAGVGGFLKGLVASQVVMLALVAAAGAAGRAYADIPPTIDGKALMLVVEVRWPPTQTTSPASEPGEMRLRLGYSSLLGKDDAAAVGPVWKEDARLVDGRWVATGAVDVFTSRGVRQLFVHRKDASVWEGIQLPLRGHPTKDDFRWSEWLPRAGTRSAPNATTFRYRVQFAGDPVRAESFGPFEIVTHAYGFHESGDALDGSTELSLRHRGEPVVIEHGGARFERANEVLALPSAEPALLVHVQPGDGSTGSCHLLHDDAGRLRVELVSECHGAADADPLTNDPERFRAARRRRPPRGRFDRETFADGGVYSLGAALLDARRAVVHRFDPAYFDETAGMPPLGVSPDERSIARFGITHYPDLRPQIVVIDAVANRRYTLPVDPARMRYKRVEDVDPAWLAHHFAWERGPDGADRLVELKGFVPIPYRGELSVTPGSVSSYRLEPARAALCDALIAFLASEFRAERLTVPDDYHHPLRVDGQQVTVGCFPDHGYVDVQAEYGATDLRVLETIARRFDAELATGEYDALFEQ